MTTAVIIPGSMTSIANCWVPVDLAFESRRGSFFASTPISRKLPGSLSFTSCGTLSRAAAPASSPKLACFPCPACASTPSVTVISPAGTFQALAAAATSMARAVAPAWRSCIQEFATAVEPPVPWTLPFGSKAKLP
jgi:hypothetical protein